MTERASAERMREIFEAVLGCDGVSDPLPGNAAPGWPIPVHQCCLVAMGVHLLDNLRLGRLAEACARHGALGVPVLRRAAPRRRRDGVAREPDRGAVIRARRSASGRPCPRDPRHLLRAPEGAAPGRRSASARVLARGASSRRSSPTRLGFGCWWTVEHHGAAEFSYSSAPEIVVAVLAQHTKRLRFGHSGVLAPFRINHPAARRRARRVRRTSSSGGRLELGLARSGGTEWDTFGVDPEASRAELREALPHDPAHVDRGARSAGRASACACPSATWCRSRSRSPHPPLWQTCTSPESFEMAGELGVGALATTLLSPLATPARAPRPLQRGLARCRPAGAFVNARRAVFTFVHCAETRREAVESRAAEAALWFVNAAPRVFQVPRSHLDRRDPRPAPGERPGGHALPRRARGARGRRRPRRSRARDPAAEPPARRATRSTPRRLRGPRRRSNPW